MSKSRKVAFGLAFAAGLVLLPQWASAADAAHGEKIFARCKACHAVGEGAKNRAGPQLNGIFGRAAGSAEDYRYSDAMKDAGAQGLVWNDDTLAAYLAAPKNFIKGNKMAFGGLKKPADVADLLDWLKTASGGAPAAEEEMAGLSKTTGQGSKEPVPGNAAPHAGSDMAEASSEPPHGTYNLGRRATDAEVAAWDIDVRPDGTGLPVGQGNAIDGEALFTEHCAACHGDFGEGTGRWPVLAGGQGTLTNDRPVKTIGSYWPYLSTVYDYVRRAMPFGNARALNNDDVYAITAYLLYLNDVVTEDDFTLSNENFGDIHLPNEDGFKPDDRLEEPEYAGKAEPCMSECKRGPVKVDMRAAVLDVTPDADNGEEVGSGSVD
ncbi:c-type cytochrome [Pseudohoeflea suaedae]|uniref:C-type cytochrome n=1 Tax=Pseudohoeflea suaedae TaxID=877384 RepID=A0A4R5PLS8_9HYPH|nr:c-type cytochrome [Pseudohoeflea suaedae]TDH36308.1 c-type cytochrome [Pseudohoeflea suaedae]